MESVRREKASLRRLEAGEKRKRASRLTDALRNDGFAVRYLPRLDLEQPTERLSAAELWLGLPNRRRGLVPVLPLLRGLDRPALLHDMLSFSVTTAIDAVADWPPHWRIALPVPGQVLAEGMLPDILGEMASLHERIDLLVDEADIVEGGDGLQQQIVALRERGVRVTLEGFGAVFGSLALLSRLPFSGVKLDRRLVHAVTDDAYPVEIVLVRAVVEAARSCRIAVVADGIETEAELRRMREFGIGGAQGPWIGPALPEHVMRSRIRDSI